MQLRVSRRQGASRERAAWRRLVVNGLLLGIAAVTLLPLLWMVSVSLMPPGEASTFPPPLLPDASRRSTNYRELFTHAGLGRYLVNSVLLAVGVTLLSLLFNAPPATRSPSCASPGATGCSAAARRAGDPGAGGDDPAVPAAEEAGPGQHYGGVIVPALASIFGIFLVRQYALSIPDELLEAARIDGAGELRIFRSIVVPVLRPIIVTLGVFTFLGTWNDFMWPLIVLTDQDLYTLPVALASLSREHVQDNELMMAGSVLTMLPVLLVFLALQRYYIEGLTAGSVKG